MLPFFDNGKGSNYDMQHFIKQKPPNRARWDYHTVHIQQLNVFKSILHDEIFEKFSSRWTGYLNGHYSDHNWFYTSYLLRLCFFNMDPVCLLYSIVKPFILYFLLKNTTKGQKYLLFILNLGIRIFLNSWMQRRILEQKRHEPVIYSMLCGFPIFSWSESNQVVIGKTCSKVLWMLFVIPGLCSVRMKHLVWWTVGVMSSSNFMLSMKRKVEAERLLRPKHFGTKLLKLRLKLVFHICYTRYDCICSSVYYILYTGCL